MEMFRSMLLLVSAIVVSTANAQSRQCIDVQIPVSLLSGGQQLHSVSGTLCIPFHSTSKSTDIDILTPGTTYNRSYWDWPQNPALYSFAAKTAQAGRATLTYDRIGTGQSSHPASAEVTVQSDAAVLHQLVSWSRLQGFNRINLIGHSYGSIVTIEEAGIFNDADRIVLTGLAHALDDAGTGIGVGLPLVIASLYPASLDPLFGLSSLDVGYLTTLPGVRRTVFYASSAEPSIIAYDESHKDTFAVGGITSEASTFFVPAPLNTSRLIAKPILIVLGQEDALFCTLPAALDCASNMSLLNAERAYYPSAPNITAAVIPNTGHDVALHPSANQSFGVIEAWIVSH